MKPEHKQAEAFHLMRYEGPGGRREWIWNSRDGITPFSVESADGKAELLHGNWHLDQYLPLYVPRVGSRIFIDTTEELARPRAIAYVNQWWEHDAYPMCETFATRDEAVEHFVKDWVSAWDGHSPIVVVVTPVLHEQFKARAAAGAR